MTQDELLALIDQAADEGWTELDLSGKGLSELPPEIGKLTQLETLILGKVEKWIWMENKLIPTPVTNQLTALPAELAALTNLKTLDLSGNLLIEIPEVVVQLQSVTSLRLVSIGVSEIPESIAQLSNLTVLDLDGNQITQIPEAIAQLSNLTVLSLHGNQITQIPEAIAQLSNLTVLSLSSNQITQIPEAIAQLSNLTEFYLWGNQISQIPESIAQLTNLTKLDFSSNQITQVPEAIVQLTNLTVLSLGGNQISQIPESIAQLTNLTKLYLGGNQINQIPESIAQFSNLTELSLGRNQISQIPESIAQLSNLTELFLGGNQISQIPESIAQLSNLTKLYLEKNKITHLPECLESLPKLENLDLRGNPLPISPEVLGSREAPGTVEGIFDYCRKLRSGNVKPLNEAKMLLVGQSSVGKTSLINRLLYNRFNANQAQTDGLNVTHWNIQVNSKDVQLNVWDFGGQEIYHATHQFFLTKRSLYLLVVNCRDSEEQNQLEYWLKLIQTFGDQSPVIIVGNKCDEQPLDLNRRALREKYPNIKAILETSCQTNHGIEELRAAILSQISQLKEVYDLLPLSWFEVKQHLEQLDEDCISYAKYVGICAKHSVLEEPDQEQLIGLLHNLGLVLNFREHPILQNNTVLKPNWVTEGIYSLLSDDDLKTVGKGILTAADLSRILNANRYPASRHHFLTELMQEFQLCFPLDQPASFLIPGLLPKEEPENADLEGDTLEFQYHYRILPDSVLSRFIVNSHEKIHEKIYWRSGVMLARCEGSETCNLARIKSDPADQKIFISINGRESTRRSFLYMIRDTFNKIHRSFANLEVDEYVPVPGYPQHPPLDYQELLGQEKMGIQDCVIGKLNLRINLRQLLDGYESIQSRQRQRLDGKSGLDDWEDKYGDIHIHIDQADRRSRTVTQHGQGDNIAGDLVQGDKISDIHETPER